VGGENEGEGTWVDELHMHIQNETSYNCFKWDREGFAGRDGTI
jgi:hypothetical protein